MMLQRDRNRRDGIGHPLDQRIDRDAGGGSAPGSDLDTRGTAGLRRLAFVLDELFRIPGTNIRFGIDSLLGLLPAGGDVAGGAVSAYTIIRAARLGAGPAVLLRMGLNVLIDTIVGAVPVLGDLFDVGWKANRRNIVLLERYVTTPQPVRSSSRAVLVVVLIGLLAVLGTAAWLSVQLLQWLIAQF